MLGLLNQYFLPCIVNIISGLYLVNSIANLKLKVNLIKVIILIFCMVVLSIIAYSYFNYFILFIFNTLLLVICSLLIFFNDKEKVIISCILTQFIMFFSELIFTIFLFVFFNIDTNDIINNVRGHLWSNILISLIAICLLKIPIFKNFIKKLLFIILECNNYLKYILFIILITTLNIILIIVYSKIDYKMLMVINTIFAIIYCCIIYYAINKSIENQKFKNENRILLSNLNEYEKMLDYQRINNHENKNQLLVIKSMVEKNDEKALDYIDEIIKEKREDNEVIYTKAKRIPSGGLQGLIYQKMLLMQENNIEVILDVSTQVRRIDLANISSKMNYDICRIVGIIVDNAIEETIKFNKKDREIIISMYVDDLFFIEVSNRIKENIDINKINEKGYTTKEEGHGYGLNLLRKIVNENDNIYNEMRVVNSIFTQIVKIKM